MNCKPGDFAKVIEPHHRAGIFVSVVEACPAVEFEMLCATDAEWIGTTNIWICRLLMGSPGVNPDLFARAYFLPGDEVYVADKYLRRIDPKADDTTEDEPEALPASLQVVERETEVDHG